VALFTKADLARVTIRKALHESSEMILAKASREFSKSKILENPYKSGYFTEIL